MTTDDSMTTLTGWGANLRVSCLLNEPRFHSEVAAVLDHTGTIARGLGRSYGDWPIIADGPVIGTTLMSRFLFFHELARILTCEPRPSVPSIIETFAPRGWFPMI